MWFFLQINWRSDVKRTTQLFFAICFVDCEYWDTSDIGATYKCHLPILWTFPIITEYSFVVKIIQESSGK